MSAAGSARKCRSARNSCWWRGSRAGCAAPSPGPRTAARTSSACYHSRDQHVLLEGSFDAEARLVALDAELVANIGAYSCYPTTCGVEPLMAMAEFPGPYDVREYACRARGVATNTCPMAPYRGVSRPVITFALERLMDKAAAAFGIDPVEIRRRNLIRKFPVYLARPG